MNLFVTATSVRSGLLGEGVSSQEEPTKADEFPSGCGLRDAKAESNLIVPETSALLPPAAMPVIVCSTRLDPSTLTQALLAKRKITRRSFASFQEQTPSLRERSIHSQARRSFSQRSHSLYEPTRVEEVHEQSPALASLGDGIIIDQASQSYLLV